MVHTKSSSAIAEKAHVTYLSSTSLAYGNTAVQCADMQDMLITSE